MAATVWFKLKKAYNELCFIEKVVIYLLALAFLFPLTLPNCYHFGYIDIEPITSQCGFRKELGDDETSLLAEVELGGRYRNQHCRPLQDVAIVVPYRNRSEHLKIFLERIHSFLIRQNLISYQIFIVEQFDDKPFNRGTLLNIGFKEALAINANFTCFIFHDVDIIPSDLRQSYACSSLPKHLCSYLDKFRYVLIYYSLFGGVVALRSDQYALTNGYSNLYSGWGGEDDDFYQRVRSHFRYIERYPDEVARCTMLTHGRYQPNEKRSQLLKHTLSRSLTDGLSNLNSTYHKLRIDTFPLFTNIRITLV